VLNPNNEKFSFSVAENELNKLDYIIIVSAMHTFFFAMLVQK
jgi:hypothetical protein